MQHIDYWLAYYNICASIDQLSKYVKDRFESITHMHIRYDRKMLRRRETCECAMEKIHIIDENILQFCKLCIDQKAVEFCKERTSEFNSAYKINDEDPVAMEDYLLYALIFRKSMFDCVAGRLEDAVHKPEDIIYSGKLSNAGEVKNLPFANDCKLAIRRVVDRKNFTKPIYEAYLRIPNKRPIKATVTQLDINVWRFPNLKYHALLNVRYHHDSYNYIISLLTMKNG